MESMKQAIFKLGDEEYGMNIMDVNIIEKFIPVEPLANAPKNLKGKIQLRGDVIPVYSLRKKFGLEERDADGETRFILSTSKGMTIAYEVDKMNEIAQLEAHQIYQVPQILESKDTSYIENLTKIGDRLILLLNHNDLISEEEQEIIKALIKK